MTDVAKAFHAQAVQCSQRANSSKDPKIKIFWDELTDEWLALERQQVKIDADWRKLRPH
jgi:hypothetical protein